MLLKLVLRHEKLADDRKPLRSHAGEFMLFDNCEMIRFGSSGPNIPVSKEEFVKLTKASERVVNEDHHVTQYFDGRRKIERLYKHLKDPKVCNENEAYHYNVVEWYNRLHNKWYRLVYDTFLFVLTDEGATIEKVRG